MSYYANGGGSFHVNKENFDALRETVNAWMARESEDEEPMARFNSLICIDTLFSWFGFDVELDDDGNIDSAYFPEDNASYTDEFLEVIAPYVEDGSRLKMTGEDGDHWLWCFKDHKFYDCDAVITYKGDPYAEEGA